MKLKFWPCHNSSTLPTPTPHTKPVWKGRSVNQATKEDDSQHTHLVALRVLKGVGLCTITLLNLIGSLMPLPPITWLVAAGVGMVSSMLIRHVWDKSVHNDHSLKKAEHERFEHFLCREVVAPIVPPDSPIPKSASTHVPMPGPINLAASGLSTSQQPQQLIDDLAKQYEVDDSTAKEVRQLAQDILENELQDQLNSVKHNKKLERTFTVYAKFVKTTSSIDKICQTVHKYFQYFRQLKHDEMQWREDFGEMLSFSKTICEWANRGVGLWRLHLRNEEIKSWRKALEALEELKCGIEQGDVGKHHDRTNLLKAYQLCIDDFNAKIAALEKQNQHWWNTFCQETVANIPASLHHLLIFVQKYSHLLPKQERFFEQLKAVDIRLKWADKGMSAFLNAVKTYTSYKKLCKIKAVENYCLGKHPEIHFDLLLREKARVMQTERFKTYLALAETVLKTLEGVAVLLGLLIKDLIIVDLVIVGGVSLGSAVAFVATACAVILLLIAIYRLWENLSTYRDDVYYAVEIYSVRSQRRSAALEIDQLKLSSGRERLENSITDVLQQTQSLRLLFESEKERSELDPRQLNQLSRELNTLQQRLQELRSQAQGIDNQLYVAATKWEAACQKQAEIEQKVKWRELCVKLNCSPQTLAILRSEIGGWLNNSEERTYLIADLSKLGFQPTTTLTEDDVLQAIFSKHLVIPVAATA